MCNYKSTKTMQQVNSIDLKIVFSEDAKEWDKYLTECLTEAIESISYQLKIVHERIENLHYTSFYEDEFDQLKVPLSTLIIISPDFLNYVNQNDNLRNYFSQLKSDRTLCILCGVKETELTKRIKENLVQFDNWKCLIAKEQDNAFIYSVIDTIYSILHANKENFEDIYSPYTFITSIKTKRQIPNYASEYKNLDSIKINDESINDLVSKRRIKPKFKLTPSRVKKGNNKVYILLDQAIEDRLCAKVTLEFKTPSKANQKCKQELREINVKKKNPYTLQFMVSDDLVKSTKVIRVNLFIEQNGQTRQLGVRLLKCEIERGENLFENLSDCLPILKNSLGLHTIDELDLELERRFRRTIPIDDLNEILAVKNDSVEQKPLIEDLLTGDSTEQLEQIRNESDLRKKDLKNETSACTNDKPKNQSANKLTPKKQIKQCNRYTEHECPTLMHFAAEHNLKKFASSLLELKASSDLCLIKNCHGLTPLLIAKLNGHNEISQLIKTYMQRYSKGQEEEEDQIDLIDQTDYVNVSIVRLPTNKNNNEQTSDFTSDGSDQSSVDGVDSVDGLILKSRPIAKSITINEYDFLGKTRPIRLGKLVDLDSLSIDSENSNDRAPPKPSKACQLVNLNEFRKRTESYEYDIVKSSPKRRADLPVSQNMEIRMSNSFNSKLNSCKTNLINRFDEMRVSSSSSSTSQDTSDRTDALKSIDLLHTINLTEPQIELLNTAKAFKMGAYTNDELEMKFKEWAAKYHYKIGEKSDSYLNNRMGKRSVSSSHLLSQDIKLESKDSGCSSRSSTIKTCLSNINLNTASSPSKSYQFRLTDWFHQLTAKLKQKTDHLHKSPKFEKKEKIVSPTKGTSHWAKKLSSSNARKSLFESKDFEKQLKTSKNYQPTINIGESKIKSLTLPLRTQSSKKESLSPTAKLRNKLNFKRNSQKTNLVADLQKLRISDKLIDKSDENERSNDKLRENLTNRLSINLIKQFNDKITNENINNNCIDVPTKLITHSSLDKEWNELKMYENNKTNRMQEQNHVNSSFEYDRIPLGPPVLAKKI